jgi:hypothetical protein
MYPVKGILETIKNPIDACNYNTFIYILVPDENSSEMV